MQTVDLVADCPLQVVTGSSRSPSPSRSPTPSPPSSATLPASTGSMGQRSSALLRPKISLTWVLRGQQQPGPNGPCPTSNGSGGRIRCFLFISLNFFYFLKPYLANYHNRHYICHVKKWIYFNKRQLRENNEIC